MQIKNTSSFKGLYLKTAQENLNSMKKKLSLMRQKINADDADELYRAVHNLTAKSQMMQYPATAKLSKVIEEIFYKIKTEQLQLSESNIMMIFDAVLELEKSLMAIQKHNKEIEYPKTIIDLKKIIVAV